MLVKMHSLNMEAGFTELLFTSQSRSVISNTPDITAFPKRNILHLMKMFKKLLVIGPGNHPEATTKKFWANICHYLHS
uniref:Uncharacterized protein n=1 Tax=Megaselia scalaris TaxID=36166 RepID=T1GEG3_MEGSC